MSEETIKKLAWDLVGDIEVGSLLNTGERFEKRLASFGALLRIAEIQRDYWLMSGGEFDRKYPDWVPYSEGQLKKRLAEHLKEALDKIADVKRGE